MRIITSRMRCHPFRPVQVLGLVVAVALSAAPARASAADPASSAGPPEPGPRTVGLDEAVRTSLAHSPGLRMAEHRLEAAGAARKQMRGRFGPVVRVEASVERWDAPVLVDVPPPAVEGFEDLSFEIEPLRVRERDTRQLSATVVQPLTDLAEVWYGHEATRAGERAAVADLQTTRRDLVRDVTRAYLDALRAEALMEVAAAAVRQLEAHASRLTDLVERGAATEGDLLETQVRLAEARAGFLRAEGGVELARSALAIRMGLEPRTQIRPAPLPTADRIVAGATFGANPAAAPRPELTLARARAEQAQAAAKAQWAALAPDVSALAQLRRVEGSLLAADQESFVGARLTWNVFEWGSGWYAAREAEARAAQAEAARDAVGDGLALALRAAEIDVRIAAEQVRVATQAVAAAQEHVRLAGRRHAAGVATNTDLLDAQALLDRARARRAGAVFDLLAARVAESHARGDSPLAPFEVSP